MNESNKTYNTHYQCRCGKKFITLDRLKFHMKSRHPGIDIKTTLRELGYSKRCV